jgi:tRNA pseudouridine65 synthase
MSEPPLHSSLHAPLKVIYQDEALIAIDKPPKRLVHRSYLARRERSVMEDLRDQVGAWVYPAHRLDRPTSGVLLFSTSSEIARALAEQFERREVSKRYLALVRGYLNEPQLIDHALKEPHDKLGDAHADPDRPAQEAQSEVRPVARVELPVSLGPFPTTRYSLVEATPLTGRRHQLRRHLHFITHPIIGDTSYGRTEHNRYFRQEWSCDRLLLASVSLSLTHPTTGEPLTLHAPLSGDFERVVRAFWPELTHPALSSLPSPLLSL